MGSSYASLELFSDAVKCFIQALDRGLDQRDRDLCKSNLAGARYSQRNRLRGLTNGDSSGRAVNRYIVSPDKAN